MIHAYKIYHDGVQFRKGSEYTLTEDNFIKLINSYDHCMDVHFDSACDFSPIAETVRKLHKVNGYFVYGIQLWDDTIYMFTED